MEGLSGSSEAPPQCGLGARGWGLGVRDRRKPIANGPNSCRDEQQASHSHYRPFLAGKARPTLNF